MVQQAQSIDAAISVGNCLYRSPTLTKALCCDTRAGGIKWCRAKSSHEVFGVTHGSHDPFVVLPPGG